MHVLWIINALAYKRSHSPSSVPNFHSQFPLLHSQFPFSHSPCPIPCFFLSSSYFIPGSHYSILCSCTRGRLSSLWDELVVVEELDSEDTEHLSLLTRPELGITFSKIHAWKLTQYVKCVFLDADTLILQNVDELFDREELSAAPDVGWPDCFNSGVFVFEPSLETYSNLLGLALQVGSFDGKSRREEGVGRGGGVGAPCGEG